MKFIVQRSEIASIIGKVQNVVSTKPPIPVLSNILIEAKGQEISLDATDLTVSMSTKTRAQVVEEGSVALPAKRFFQLVRELTTPEIEVSADKNGVAYVISGTSKFRLNGMDKSEFPTFPEIDLSHSFSMAAQDLKDMLAKTVFAAARDDNRQVLNGLLMQIENNILTFVGTDGKRLAKVFSTIDFQAEQKITAIVPTKGIEEMIRLLDGEKEARVSIMDGKIALEAGSFSLISKLLSGQFPDYERVIPDDNEMNSVTLHRDEIMTLLRQVSLFTTDLSHSVRLTFENGELHLQATSSDIGEGKVNMPVEYANEKLEIAFNPHYFLDVLRHCRDETVKFAVSNSFNPGTITDSTNAYFVIMPMRLNAD